MSELRLITERLELVAATHASVRAQIDEPDRWARLLDARVPDGWPPELTEDVWEYTAERLAEGTDSEGWWTWYFVLRRDADGGRVVIGCGGYKGRPTQDGTAEVGYSVMRQYRRAGYATEAARALVGWAFGHPEVTRVCAETYPDLVPSRGVIAKLGFGFEGPGSEEGVARYSMTRELFEKNTIATS
ncbi:MAG: GNAT family N-acetyltransferase [Gemmatimonadales bacterium]|nr:GNAT family N-acetyltransferase [Gemmatimonadales bacterium]